MRTIDRLLTYVDEMEGLSPTEKWIIKHRIEPCPKPEEYKEARNALYPDEALSGWSQRRVQL